MHNQNINEKQITVTFTLNELIKMATATMTFSRMWERDFSVGGNCPTEVSESAAIMRLAVKKTISQLYAQSHTDPIFAVCAQELEQHEKQLDSASDNSPNSIH